MLREGDADLGGGRFSPEGEARHRDVIEQEEGPDAHHLDPVLHRRLDVAHDIAVLADLPEDAAHSVNPFAPRNTASASFV